MEDKVLLESSTIFIYYRFHLTLSFYFPKPHLFVRKKTKNSHLPPSSCVFLPTQDDTRDPSADQWGGPSPHAAVRTGQRLWRKELQMEEGRCVSFFTGSLGA